MSALSIIYLAGPVEPETLYHAGKADLAERGKVRRTGKTTERTVHLSSLEVGAISSVLLWK